MFALLSIINHLPVSLPLQNWNAQPGKKQLVYIFETDEGELRYVPAKDCKHNFLLKNGVRLLERMSHPDKEKKYVDAILEMSCHLFVIFTDMMLYMRTGPDSI